MSLQTILQGQVETLSGAIIKNVQVELKDTGPYGLIATTYTSPTGTFTFSLLQAPANMLNNGILQPLYCVKLGSAVLFEQEIAFSPGENVIIQIEDSIYADANSDVADQMLLNGQVSTMGGEAIDFPQIRVDLINISSGDNQLIASSNVAPDGQFSIILWDEVSVIYQNTQTEYRLFVGDVPLTNYPAGEEQVDIQIEQSIFNNALNNPEPPFSFGFSGNVSLEQSGEALENIRIVVEGGQNSAIGHLSEQISDAGGNFNHTVINTAAIWLRYGTLQPSINTYLGDVLLTSQTMPVGEGEVINVRVDDEVYDEASGGGTPVYDPVFHEKVTELTDLSMQIDAVQEALSSPEIAIHKKVSYATRIR